MDRHFMGMHRAVHKRLDMHLREVTKQVYLVNRQHYSKGTKESKLCFKTGFWHTFETDIYEKLKAELLKERT